MADRELAQRLVTYADAVVALAFVGVSAFGVAVADPDVQCNLAGAKLSVIVASSLIGVIFSVFLLVLRRWELDLSAENGLSAKGRRYSRHLNLGRYLLIWISVMVTYGLVYGIDRSVCTL